MQSIPFKKIFNKPDHVVIGSLHFPPLLGFPDFPGYKVALRNAKADLKAFEDGGVDAVILENNYGLSAETIQPSHAIAMGHLCSELRSCTKLPLGASVLWNDYESAFALAHTYGLDFIRIPVLVDTVETYCGVIEGNVRRVKQAQQLLRAEKVAVFADIHVKHAKLLSSHSLTSAAKKAQKAGASAVIVTGNWTGESPEVTLVENLKKHVGSIPILIGSGVDQANINSLMGPAHGVIVSTSLKKGAVKAGERNVKGYEQRVDPKKVRSLMDALN